MLGWRRGTRWTPSPWPGRITELIFKLGNGELLGQWRLDDRHALVVSCVGGAVRLTPAVGGDTGWRRADPGPGTATAFIAALSAATGPAGTGPPSGFRIRHFAPQPESQAPQPDSQPGSEPQPATSPERGFTVDQTNESVVVSERFVVKWLLAPEQRPHPAPPLLAHLAEVGFRRTPAPYAALWWSPEQAGVEQAGPSALLALVAGYLPEADDGWDWCVADLLAEWSGGSPARFPADLGVLAADLHAALATPSATFPEPLTQAGPAEVAAWARGSAEAVRAALACTTGADRAWLQSKADHLRGDAAPPWISQTPVLHIHGDLHVGQILRWRGGLAVTDFDGNPAMAFEEPVRQPAARDIAQLLTSLEHVAQIADKRTGYQQTGRALAFAATARQDCFDAYRARLTSHGASHVLDERLLNPFAVEQECRELIYAAKFLPRWTYAPMNVLRSWYPDQPETT
jgi:maltokinase